LCGGISDESDSDKEELIIKNISKEVTIDKGNYVPLKPLL
jgi:hypothetical protein